ncbi:MAG: PAS domain-containing protein [Candidatus Eisenbacteria bacterium]
MRKQTVPLSGREVTFGQDELIVSKTDLKGHITYANHVFQRVSGYTEAELMGQPHNLIRHPGMPSCVFKLLWDTLQDGREIFAYVLNQARNGDEYWVFAHVTPSFDKNGRCVGYHSNRRVPYPDALPKVKDLYAGLVAEERRHSNLHEGMSASMGMVTGLLQQKGQSYAEFVFSLSEHTRLERSIA